MFLARTILTMCLLAATVHAEVQITVVPTLAPNRYGSGYWNQWVSNSLYALSHGLSSYGDPTLPSYYQALPSSDVPVSSMIVTGFTSWMGQASPETIYGSAFAGEHGNRLTTGVYVQGNGEKISIANLSFSVVTSDPSSGLDFSLMAGSFSYTSDYEGLIFNLDGSITTVTSGSADQLVDAIVARGPGQGWAVYEGDAGGTLQEKIDLTVDGLVDAYPNSIAYTGTYALSYQTQTSGQPITATSSNSATTAIQAVPEPTSVMLLAIALAAMGAHSRRRFYRRQ